MRLPLVSLFLVSMGCALAQPTSTENKAAARAAFEEARKLFSSDMPGAVAGLRRAVDLDPDYYEAHQYFILYSNVAVTRTGTDEEKKAAAEKVRAENQARYERLAAEQPQRAAYQYALGSLHQYSDPDRSLRHFERTVQLDPKCGDAYDSLAIHAEIRGQLERSREYHRKSVEVQPEDVKLWRHYVGSMLGADIDRAVTTGLEMAKRHPDDAASIISYLATRARTEAKAQEIYELLRTKFAKASVRALTGLFSIYLRTDAARALALADEMLALAPDNKEWPVLATYAKAVRDLDGELKAGRAAEALAALEKITLPRYGVDRRMLDLAKARAQAALGQKDKAYADLFAVVTLKPTDETLAALHDYGRQLGKTASAVTAELASARAAKAKPATPFTLVNLATGKPVTLDAYKGRVVLVNFWYPLCGPCRGEFPFLQAVLEKYRAKGFEILAINGHDPEEHMVMPLLKGWKLDFLPLKGTEEIVKAYKVRGFPANFLIAPDGSTFYEPPPVSTIAAQRELELQIEALLARKA
jgi:thiol-disulfide isomerase/thioredoxin/Tfp pilus assembly protein PilF